MRRILIIAAMLLLLISACGGCHAKIGVGSFTVSGDLTFDDFTFKASDEQDDALQRRAQARAAAEIRRLRSVAAAKVQAKP